MRRQSKSPPTHADDTSEHSAPLDTAIIPEPEPSENIMEVHHHSHHTHGKKNWRSYAWEFLMLFLAVFCGFLAEYQLEHKIESDREKVYMQNMVNELEADIASYRQYAEDNKLAFRNIDSLMYLFKQPDRKKHLPRIYLLARTLTIRIEQMFTHEATYDQLKSSGQLRLIRNKNLLDSITAYYTTLKQIDNQNIRIRERTILYQSAMGKVFDASVMLDIYKTRKEPDASVQLISDDRNAVNEVLSWAQYLYGSYDFQKNYGFVKLTNAENLIALIRKEYHLHAKVP